MLYIPHVDPIVIAVRPNPLDPDNAFVEVDRDDQSAGVPLDVEHDAIGRHNTRRRVEPLHIGSTLPSRLPHLIEPGVKTRPDRGLIAMTDKRRNEGPQGSASDDPPVEDQRAPILGARPLAPKGGRADASSRPRTPCVPHVTQVDGYTRALLPARREATLTRRAMRSTDLLER